MLDLSPNALIGIIAGPLLVAILAASGWFARRAFAQTDKEIARIDKEFDKMAITQKEVGEKLAGLLTREQLLNMKLEEGFEQVDSNFDTMKATFRNETDNIRKDMVVMSDNVRRDMEAMSKNMEVLSGNMDKNMEVMAANVDKDIKVMQVSFRELRAYVGANKELVDRDLAEIREWLKGDGTWPTRGKGNGSP